MNKQYFVRKMWDTIHYITVLYRNNTIHYTYCIVPTLICSNCVLCCHTPVCSSLFIVHTPKGLLPPAHLMCCVQPKPPPSLGALHTFASYLSSISSPD